MCGGGARFAAAWWRSQRDQDASSLPVQESEQSANLPDKPLNRYNRYNRYSTGDGHDRDVDRTEYRPSGCVIMIRGLQVPVVMLVQIVPMVTVERVVMTG